VIAWTVSSAALCLLLAAAFASAGPSWTAELPQADAPGHQGSGDSEFAGSDSAGVDSLAGLTQSWFALPNVFYSPETGFGGGIVAGYFFRLGEDVRPSGLQVALALTEREQYLAEFYPEFYWSEGYWWARLEVSAKEYPDVFYGIGPDVPSEAEESYTSRSLGVVLVASKKVAASTRLGLRLRLLSAEIEDTEPGRLLDSGDVPGHDGGTVAGIGPVFTRDTRDNTFYSMSGALAEVRVVFHAGVLASDCDFTRAVVDLRAFVSPAAGHSLGCQLYSEAVTGDTPFFALPVLGGSRIMRGYREGRFRDDVLLSAQGEYRFPLWRRFRGALFSCVGAVGDAEAGISGNSIEYSAGVGLRFRLSAVGTHVRLDYAIGREDSAVYLTVGEAF
jgi:hypothetical protein